MMEAMMCPVCHQPMVKWKVKPAYDQAIQALLSNYRGTKVGSIPAAALPTVLERLASAAESLGKMPHQRGDTAAIYVQFAEALEQIRRT